MGLKFGTSGVRGLAEDMTDYECYIFTQAFLKYLFKKDLIKKNSAIALAGDYRPSTTRIMQSIAMAVRDKGLRFINCGIVPTPTVSFFGFKRRIPSIMVTGSHIPYDRNGIKYILADGEVLKEDEKEISKVYNILKFKKFELDKFDNKGKRIENINLGEVNDIVKDEYIDRYVKFFSTNCLKGKKVVVYEHSTVLREILPNILEKLGAKVVKEEFSDKFVPIDTEAISDEILKKAKIWIKRYKPDAIFSADGDGDRPMLFDELGNFIRGDILGIICAKYLRADSVSTTASCNTALEKVNIFKKINRTKIGSPYVIAAMNKDKQAGYKRIVSYEANGGFLLASKIENDNKILEPLPTRDAVLPLLVAIVSASIGKITLSGLFGKLPQRFVYSNSIKGIPTKRSLEILSMLQKSDAKDKARDMFDLPSGVTKFDFTDGTRIFLDNGEIVHIRPSGNSPELRSYCEAKSVERAKELTYHILDIIKEKVI